MRRFRFLGFSIILLLLFSLTTVLAGDGGSLSSQDPTTDVSNGDPTNDQDPAPEGDDEPKCPPDVPTDTFYICLGDAIYDTLIYEFDDMGSPSISLAIHDGPGELTWEVTDKLYGYYSYTPVTDGTIHVEYLVVDPLGDSTYNLHEYVIYVDEPPLFEDQYGSAKLCRTGDTRLFQVIADDPEATPLTFELLSVFGDLSSVSGWLAYVPDTSGVYTFEIAVYDDCNTVMATVYDTIRMNTHPEMVTDDTTIYACGPGEICFDIDMFDFDGDPVWVEQSSGPGTLTQIDADTWRQCFEAGIEDSVTYTFHYIYDNECTPYGLDLPSTDPKCLTDSLRVTVIFTDPPVIICPEAKEYVICDVETFCFDIVVESAGAGELSYNILSDNATIDGLTVCLVADATAEFDIVIEVVDICGKADTCTVPISVELNQPPYVNLASDFEVTVCVTETICFDAFVGDVDLNLNSDSVVAGFGYYDSETDRICFVADTAGVYTLVLTATDSCGLSATDTTLVTVVRPPDPEVNLPEDFTVNMCGETTICMDAEIIADSIHSITVFGSGYYDTLTSQLCFDPDTAGIYTIILEVVGECTDLAVSDTVDVTVIFPPSPFVDLGADFARNMCTPEEICVDVTTIEIYETFEVSSFAVFNPSNRQICFTPDTSGIYTLVAIVTDSCEMSASDTVLITVDLNNAPIISHMPDTSLYLCYPQEICLDVTIVDPDGDLDTVYVNQGTYDNVNEQFCFMPFSGGTYELIITAKDTCGNITEDTAVVTIETDEGISFECPNDTTVFTCSLEDTFCFDFDAEGIPEGAQIDVTGIGTWYDSLNQQICFSSECSNTNLITVTVTTPCDEYTCSFTVTVVCNRDPLVILPPDTSISSCEAVEVCVPVGISDPDDNLVSVGVFDSNGDPFGTYNPFTGLVCFLPDTVGVYTITVIATDACDATDSDVILISVLGNSPPEIDVVTSDIVYDQCEPEEICLQVDVIDIDGNLDTIYAIEGGVYNGETGEVCIMPDGSGTFCGAVIAVDVCGLVDTAFFCVTVETGNYVYIECDIPEPYTFDLCTAQEVCVPLAITGSGYTIETSHGSTWANDQLCFPADTAGTYIFTVVGTAECNSDTCVVPVIVTIAEPVDIVCPDDTTIPLCEPSTTCFPFSITGPYNDISVNDDGGAYIDGMTVCVPFDEPGVKTITLTASGDCGTDVCEFTVTANFNSPPTISVTGIPPDTVCELTEICLPVTAFDVDGNLDPDSISSPQGEIRIDGDTLVCFTPDSYGTHQIEVIAIDDCGEKAADTVEVVIVEGVSATISDPNPLTDTTICGPETICLSAPVWPDNAIVTLTEEGIYDPATGQVCIPVSESRTYNIRMIAQALCGSDTSDFAIEVTLSEAPVVSCPGSIDTVLCFVEPQTLCYPVTVTGTDVSVRVESEPHGGSYDGDSVCIDITGPGTYEIDVIADGFCGSDTCHTSITVTADQVPTLTLPSFQTFTRCLDNPDSICLDGIVATDDESVVTLTMTMACDTGVFTLTDPGSGTVCFLPDRFGIYEFCFTVEDDCHTIDSSFEVEVLQEEDCDLCIEIWMDTDSCSVVGVHHDVKMYIDTKVPIGGFDLLLSYDVSALTLVPNLTTEGTVIEGWEYFTYDNDSPTGHLRLVGLAETNNGPYHPSEEDLLPNGLFMVMTYYIKNDQNLGDQYLPINFIWFDCGDNAFSGPLGNNLYYDTRIYDAYGELIWDENDDITYPEEDRSGPGFERRGTPDWCIQDEEGKPSPIRCVEFHNAAICVIHPDSIDDRGDINLNGVAYEIADAVVFSNYFIYGLSAFTVNVAGQIAASDVNADGLTLSVGDLVYLIRVIIGDADPIPKIGPLQANVTVSTATEHNLLTVATDAEADIGAVYVVYDIADELVIDDVGLGSDAGGMDLMWGIVDGQLKVLVYSLGTEAVESGIRTILEIPVSGDGSVSISHVEVVDYQGRPYTVAGKAGALPSDFTLRQNYPNPFNPTTTISFDLPARSEWTIEIYSITGSLVRGFSNTAEAGMVSFEWDGTSQSGDKVASGVYFYRLQAGDFSETRKMVLLK
ncbi:MAG: T9SS type A sorting domain-containing protein [candidate division Zixibacteria bacterium]|nr:T9SS type A sorting domain-containing protein [candidate division Zixibacteria bacterium]